MKLNLPNVTVVIVDCVAHELAKLAIRDTLKLIEPAEVIAFSDKPIFENHIYIEANDRYTALEALWFQVPKYVQTSHILNIQWDGWVINSEMWNDDFLNFDYIGAPWPWHEKLNVGNGGFSLRSKKLMDHLIQYNYNPIDPEDDILCRKYRPTLEYQGFKWADIQMAMQFSIEHGDWRNTFGFHNCQNFIRLLNSDLIRERRLLANSYIKNHVSWKHLEKALREPLSA